jgi:hypothetical protein
MDTLKSICVLGITLFYVHVSCAQDSSYIFVYPSAKEIDITVHASVSLNAARYVYDYKLVSLASSRQDVWTFDVSYEGNVSHPLAPGGWIVLAGGGVPRVSWSGSDSSRFVRPGETLVGLRFGSNALPCIRQYLAGGWVPPPILEIEPDSIIGDSIFENRRIGKTVGPKPAPDLFVAVVFLDSLISYTSQSLTLGWISNQSTTDKYTNLFSIARSQLESADSTVARVTLTTVLENVTADSAASLLTSEAYALLYFNTKYLVELLPSTVGFPIPDLPAALTISSANVAAVFTGDNFLITGYNHRMDGTPASDGDDRHGIVTTTIAARNAIRNSLRRSQRDNINGSGGAEADVVQQALAFDVAALIDTVLAHVDQTIPVRATGAYGSADDPVILHADHGLIVSGPLAGTGILVIDGPLFVSGTMNWTGLVVQRSEARIPAATSVTGNLAINGGMLVYNTASLSAGLQVSNRLFIRASQEALEMLRTKL